jgi:NTE family protein
MSTESLVLSGGGPLAVGWELGVLRGLREGGIDLGRFERVIGTSAGAIAGALLTSGAPLEPIRVQPEQRTGASPRSGPMDPEVAGQMFGIVAMGGTADQALRARVGGLALQTRMPERAYLDLRRHIVPDVAWPRALVVTAVDTADGAFVSWTVEDHVPLPHAIAAATSLPGISPPVTIGGRRFMDGGLRSAMSADLAAGDQIVLIIAALPGTEWPVLLAAEMAAIEEAGGTVVPIRLDSTSAAALGPDRTDETRQELAFEAGRRQGRAASAAISAVVGPGVA